MPSPLSPRRAAAVWLSLLALAAPLAGCGSGSHASGTALPHARTAPLLSMFEAQGQLLRDPVATLTQLRGLGVHSVRVFVPWASPGSPATSLAPDPLSRTRPAGFAAEDPAAYSAVAWAPYDGLIRAAPAYGIAVDLTLEGPPPLWATGPGSSPRHPQWLPKAADYGAFVHAVGRRYSGGYAPAGGRPLPRVHLWSIWNEPNYGTQLAPQAVANSTVEVAPALYRGLLDAAWSNLRSTGHAGDTILWGELAPRGQTTGDNPGKFSGMVPLRFVRALYCVDGSLQRLRGQAATLRGCPASGSAAAFAAAHPALFAAAGIALHLYPTGAEAPNQVTQAEPDYADLATVGRFETTIDRIAAVYGSAQRFPIYDTEFGEKTKPPYFGGAAPATAALYLNWAEYLHWRDPRIRTYDQYLIFDPPATSNFDTGLFFVNGSPKPSLQAFRMPLFLPRTTGPKAGSLEVWGCVRPAHAAASGRPGEAELQFAAPGAPFRTLRTIPLADAAGYFDLAAKFPGTGEVRVRWRPPRGPALISRTVAITLR